MRTWSVLIVTLVMLIAGCSKQITGVAQVDPHGPATSISKDGFGIVVGDPNARVHIELYTEPQCNHCADLQKDFGDQISSYMRLGQLVVTYRPLTFLDDDRPSGYSHRVANAMFLAAGPDTSAKAFQAFVQDLWGHQNPGGQGPTDTQIADMARESGVPTAAVDAMRAAKPALDVQEMEDTNFEYLYEIDPMNTGTPTVFDLTKNTTVDIYDNNWLSKLMST